MKRNIHLIAAARPNFMKIAPLYHALAKESWADPKIVHTGQHYDLNMSDAFFHDLQLPEPHIHLGAGTGSHAEQTGKVMMAYEKVVLEHKPDMVVVVGDVNSTIACTLAATKVVYDPDDTSSLNRPLVAHLEAGLRSFDRSMPEEVNRLATDVLADILWTPSSDGDEHLLHEGVAREKIIRVGNIMIDSLEMMRDKIEADPTYIDLGLKKGEYAVVTLHRPANVDNPTSLKSLCDMLTHLAKALTIVFPVHPRTRKNLENTGLLASISGNPNIKLLEPQNYISFMNLVFNCRIAITDSGGLQEETTYLGIPCLTLRPNTERPITITQGTNQLGTLESIEGQIDAVLRGESGKGSVPDLWDGKTAGRVVDSIKSILNV
ncbi:MAG: UDP-N-acetylglucosamine 2-epimerase (non-hydrolyzing) [gamma proteobacterium endosymbiont of Lamellibrachia anaximandri]|nr:UDP-N-acetylglucosamine 2-epimerase (non-hydrolyzing) [gamma proteobacterium endosymbiont of Lamellibrachia anaximandri]MBL3534126.1 UDP-N-acetylglucosamine 2-epimerase (non-hydrolyzing) [gamma proteobacterium endosymbiont of Lamellibrachia anaximandri]